MLFNSLATEFIYLVNLPNALGRLQYFFIFMYIWWLLKFLVVFFMESLPNLCCHARTFQLVSQQSLASIINKKPHNFNKTVACSHHCSLCNEHRYWGIGIPGYTFGSTIHAWTIPPPSWCSASPVTTDSLLSLQWAFPPKTLKKRRLNSLYECILRLRPKKVWHLTNSILLAAEFIYLATSVECAGPINRPTTVKGLKIKQKLSMWNKYKVHRYTVS